jgi:predicted RNA-binding Zn-ribbon protein involved in translation (DUF1610 family)
VKKMEEKEMEKMENMEEERPSSGLLCRLEGRTEETNEKCPNCGGWLDYHTTWGVNLDVEQQVEFAVWENRGWFKPILRCEKCGWEG